MKNLEWRCRDKAEWPRGPWDAEPDKKQWRDPATGLPCMIVRNQFGALCGYVGVPEGHALHGRGYDDVDADCHGGLTFARGCVDGSPEAYERWRAVSDKHRENAARYPKGDSARYVRAVAELDTYEKWQAHHIAGAICHLAEPGDEPNVWWFGFDCGHAGDFTPGLGIDAPLGRLGMPTGWGTIIEYRDLAYVEAECTKLAAQLRALA